MFEKRYHAILVDADEYLLELLRYIHLNPVRARLVDHPAAYAWCSHHAYMGSIIQPWVTTDFALSMFHAQRDSAIAAYGRFIDEDIGHPSLSPLLDCMGGDTRVLGSDEFASKLLGAAWRPKSKQTLTQLIAEACDQFLVSEESLLSRNSQRRLTRVRAWIAHQAVIRRIASLSAVARHFGRAESPLRLSVKRNFNYP